MDQQQRDMPIRILEQIHMLVQKLRESGKSVNSQINQTVKIVEGTVVHETSLQITGDLTVSVVDSRSPEEVKLAAEQQKAVLEAKAQEAISKVDEVITVVEAEVSKRAK